MRLTIRIALVGDLHYPLLEGTLAVRRGARDRMYRAVLEAFFRSDADVHIALGDVTHDGRLEEWSDIARLVEKTNTETQRAFHYVLGNHDTLRSRKRDIVLAMQQPRFHMMETQGVRLVFLDTTRETSPTHWGGLVDAEQLAWLDSMAGLPKAPTVVLAHHPFPSTTKGSDEPMMFLEDSKVVQAAIEAFSTHVIWCNGHNHAHSIVKPTAAPSGWTHVQSAAVLSNPSFRLLTWDGDALQVTTHVFADEDIVADAAIVRTDLADYFHHPAVNEVASDYELNVTFAE